MWDISKDDYSVVSMVESLADWRALLWALKRDNKKVVKMVLRRVVMKENVQAEELDVMMDVDLV